MTARSEHSVERPGKVSATKDAHGQWHIEPAELHRVYPPRTEASTDERQSQRLSKALCFQHDADGSTTRVPRRHDADLAWVVPTPVSSQEPHPGTGRGGAPAKGRHGWQFRQFGCRIFMRFVTEITESASHGTPFTADSLPGQPDYACPRPMGLPPNSRIPARCHHHPLRRSPNRTDWPL